MGYFENLSNYNRDLPLVILPFCHFRSYSLFEPTAKAKVKSFVT